MRVAVVGAGGNVATAVLRAPAAEPAVASVAGTTYSERTKLGSTWYHHTALDLASTTTKGVVTLSDARGPDGVPGRGRLERQPGPGRCGHADDSGDLVPDGEADGHFGSVVGGGEQVAVGSAVG
ncbi:hypothetical protein ACFWOL_27400 [Streptomyces sp. NPDC058442]|uniref:hypothetical protein n=1 Tax=Streptomyces sp. NPDC058442 TaxID=3346503 RepID=UPI0036661E0F